MRGAIRGILCTASVVQTPIFTPTEVMYRYPLAEVRAWARAVGLPVPDRGRLHPDIWQAWHDANEAN